MSDSPSFIYCDGGVIGPNPSPVGGTWAWCWVNEDGEKIKSGSGVVVPQNVGLPRITNNLTELLAGYYALQSVGKDWGGTLHTDSRVTQLRLTVSHKFKGIPENFMNAVLSLRQTRNYKVRLVAGHPTRKELEQGFSNRNRLPVSIHNRWCDRECRGLADSVLSGELVPDVVPIAWGVSTKKRGLGL